MNDHENLISRLVFFVVCLILIQFKTVAQLQHLKFNYLTVENGLVSNRVSSIMRDSQGYLWIGTEKGLNKWDGMKMKKVESLNGISVRCLFEDSRRNIYVGSDGFGLFKYDRNIEAFGSIPIIANQKRTEKKYRISSIIEDSNKNIWISSYNGLIFWNQVTNQMQFIPIPDPQKRGLANYVDKMSFDSNGNLWLVTNDCNLLKFDCKNFQFEQFSIPGQESNVGIPKEMAIDKTGVIWIGSTTKGLCSFNPQTHLFTKYNAISDGFGTNGLDISGFFVEKDYLWIAVNHGGINRYNFTTKRFKYFTYDEITPDGLNNDGVWCIYKDQEGILYAGTSAGGLNIYNPKNAKFKLYQHRINENKSLIYNVIWCLFEDHEGMIWIGTDGGGISILNPKTESFTNYQHNNSDEFSLSANAVMCITEDNKNDVWIGTWGGGLNKWERKTGKFFHYKSDPNDSTSISNMNVYSLENDNGKLLINYITDGFDVFDTKLGVVKKYRFSPSQENGLSEKIILRFNRQNDNKIALIGGMCYSLFDAKKNNFTNKKFDIQPPIVDVICDRDSNFWIATTNSGLVKINPNGVRESFHAENGFIPDHPCAILEDNNGNIWLSSDFGLTEYNKKTKKFSQYTKADGLQGNQFTSFAKLKAKDGTLYFGGYNGLSAFNPSTLERDNSTLKVYIDEFRIFNEPVLINKPGSPLDKSIAETKEIKLSHSQSVFSFGFTAINFTSPENVKYVYKLEGYEEKWNYTTVDRRYVSYTNLDPGTYNFVVKASVNGDVWFTAPATMKIIIAPAFWQTWWFRLTSIVFLIGFGLLINLQRVIYLKRNNLLLEKKVKTRTIKLNESLYELELQNESLAKQKLEIEKMANEIHEADQSKLRFFTNVSHELKTPLTLIISPLENILSSKKSIDFNERLPIFEIMYNNSKRLLRLINQLLDFRKIDSNAFQVKLIQGDLSAFAYEIFRSYNEIATINGFNYQFVGTDKPFIAWFDPDIVEKIVHNVISNAFKYTPNQGEIIVSISSVSQNTLPTALITVKDNGIGIESEKLEAIFNYFNNSQKPYQRFASSGIGLSLTKELVNLCGGRIKVESKPNLGTTFYIQIEVDNKKEGSEIENVIKSIQQSENISIEANEITEILKSRKAVKVKPEKNAPTVLIVEDNPDIRFFIRSELCDTYHIQEASNGRIGFEISLKLFPDLIISDVMMPVMDGIEFCRKIKADLRICHIPVILLTVRTAEQNQIDGFESGADDYIAKPFNMSILKAKLKNMLVQRDKMRERYLNGGFTTSGSSLGKLKNLDEEFLLNYRKIIKNHLSSSELDADLLSKELAISRTILYNKTKVLTGLSVNLYIRIVRLEQAMVLLKSGSYRVNEVADITGFSNPAYFARCFTQQFSKPPTAFIP